MTDNRRWVEIRIKFTTKRTAQDQAEAFEKCGVKTKIKKEGKFWRVFKYVSA
jgi:hypothetical protein